MSEQVKTTVLTLGEIVVKFEMPQNFIDEINNVFDEKEQTTVDWSTQLAGKIKKEKLVNEVYSIKEIILAIKENFSYCMYQFNKFWFIYINRWRNELKDLETLGIGMVVVINSVKNKDFIPKKTMRLYHKDLMGSDTRGVNAMSISEITGIPRPTVVRKLKYLIDKKYLHINKKKLITFNAKDSAFITTKGMVNKNMISLSHFIYKVFNQIRIINS